jgi:hypothetical protein
MLNKKLSMGGREGGMHAWIDRYIYIYTHTETHKECVRERERERGEFLKRYHHSSLQFIMTAWISS